MRVQKFFNAVVVVLGAALLTAQSAGAGSMCDPVTPNAGRTSAALTVAVNVQRHLEIHQPAAALIARVGDDVSDRGLKYTHAGIVVRDHADGRWTVVHGLNHCGTAESALFNEGLGAFFLDTPYMLDVLVIIPSDALQRRLAELVQSDVATRLHEPAYNMLAHPFNSRYQNSNGWLAELVAMGLTPKGTRSHRKHSQEVMVKTGFTPTVVKLSRLEQLGALMFRANVRFDDHSLVDQVDGRFRVVTVASLRQWVKKIDPGATVTELIASADIRFPRTAFPDPDDSDGGREP